MALNHLPVLTMPGLSIKTFFRLVDFLKDGKIIIGDKPTERYIAPTVIDHVSLSEPVMQDEIFGPILPVIEYDELTQAIAIINQRPKL